jgi:hypothetical protein
MGNWSRNAAFMSALSQESAMANPPDKSDKIREKPRHCLYDGPGRAIPPEQRVRAKKYPRFDYPVIPRLYWYLTAGLAGAALVLGLLLGWLVLG